MASVTHHGWEEPEEKIGIVFFINREVARVTANIVHLRVQHDRLRSRLLDLATLYQRRQEERRANVLVAAVFEPPQFRVYIQEPTRTFVRQHEEQRAQS